MKQGCFCKSWGWIESAPAFSLHNTNLPSLKLTHIESKTDCAGDCLCDGEDNPGVVQTDF